MIRARHARSGKRADQREREARREIQLLLNEGGMSETDFYVYRYLGNEGFLPGYNFPAAACPCPCRDRQ